MFLTVFTLGCGNQKTIDNITYDTYGLFNKSEKMNPDIEYEIIVGNVVWSIILIETIVAPVYFVGFSLYQPVAKKDENFIKGQVR
jgi:hypothetical protein